MLAETAPDGRMIAAPYPGSEGIVIATVPPELPTGVSAESVRNPTEAIVEFPALSASVAWSVWGPSRSGELAVNVAWPGPRVKAQVIFTPSSITWRLERATP